MNKGKLSQGELLNITINFVGSILKAMKTTQKAADDRNFFVKLAFNEGDTFKSSSLLIYQNTKQSMYGLMSLRVS
jgi:hypothetical protein